MPNDAVVEAALLPPSDKADVPYQRFSALQHGHTTGRKYSPTYHSWQAMLARCRYPDRDVEKKHIGRGIVVCERWQDFNNFLVDLGERPLGTTLDRIDNNKGYEPGNCRWATSVEQARNRRNKRLTYEQALSIARRMLAGDRAVDVAKDFGISESLPREIHKRRTWKDAHDDARR